MLARSDLGLPLDYAAPSGTREARIAALLSELLEVEPVGMDDDFFDLGGDSLAAETFAAAFRTEFDVDLKPGQLARLNTARKIAGLLGADETESLPSNVVAFNPAGKRDPVFAIHGRAGLIFFRPEFLSGLHEDQPLYAFQIQGYDGKAEPLDNVEDIATAYLDSMLAIRPNGPWHIVSFCAGGYIALEIIRQMQAKGLQPSSATLVDINARISNRQRNEWKWRRRPIARANIPVLSAAVVRVGMLASTIARRYRVFVKTGLMGDLTKEGVEKSPRLAEAFVRRRNRRYDKITDQDDHDEGLAEDHRKRRREAYSLEAGRRAMSLLELALQIYEPERCDYPANVILNTQRSVEMHRPDHPLRRALPNLNLIVWGVTHREAVSSTETARIIQDIVDHPPAGTRKPDHPAAGEMRAETLAQPGYR